MRIDVRKFLFTGPATFKQTFFEEMQEAGFVEFIDLKKVVRRTFPREVEQIHEAIKVLRALPVTEQEENFDFSCTALVVEEILQQKTRIEKLEEERRILRQEVARIEPFGDFSLPEIHVLESETKRKWRFFTAKHSLNLDFSKHPDIIPITLQHGLEYLILFSREEVVMSGMIEMQFEASLHELQEKQKQVARELAEIEEGLKLYEKWNQFLHAALYDALNRHHLTVSEGYASYAMDDSVFAIEGWVAKSQVKELEKRAEDLPVHYEEIAVEEGESIPTHLENKGFARIGEDLVHIYDTPSINDKDPSPWVLWSFAFFFAIILGDGGYGAIILSIALLLRYKMPSIKGVGLRVLKLMTILGVTCIGWGILTHSFFGISPDIDSKLRNVSGLQWLTEQKTAYHIAEQDATWLEWVQKYPQLRAIENPHQFLATGYKITKNDKVFEISDKFADNILLELALAFGVIHITLSLLRALRQNWSGVGWICFMVGAYLYFPSILKTISLVHILTGLDPVAGAALGYQLLFSGMGGAVFLAILQYKAMGALEIVNLIQVFSDVLSYLRLYALGLAGAMMSATFNDIGTAIPPLLGMVVILIGHTINLVLSIMGGVIHGLRLNFLEWYHYSFEGGGKMLHPLKLIKIR